MELRVRYAAAIIALLFTSLLAEEFFWNNSVEASRAYPPSSKESSPGLVANAGVVLPAQKEFSNTAPINTEFTASADTALSQPLTSTDSSLAPKPPQQQQPKRLLELTENGWVFNRSAKTKNKKAKSTVPAGFEHLTGEQLVLADVYYGGRYLTQTLVTHTPTHVRIEDPAAVVGLLPEVKNPGEIETALSALMSNNTDSRCFNQQQRDCGILEPAVADVIFNPDSFKLELFVNPNYLAVQPIDELKYLPPSSSDNATFVQQLALGYSGSDDGDDRYNLSGSSVLGYREQSIRSNWNITDTEDFTVDTLYWERDKNGKVGRAGFLRGANNGLTFSASPQLLGGHFGSSRQTRIDYETQGSNDIQIYMPIRGRVEVYRDAKLIATEILEIGNHMLDTRNYPSGGYNIDIVIKDGGNVINRERRYFVKDNRLPNKDAPEYYVEFGQVVDNREEGSTLPTSSGDTWQLRSGYNYRVADSLGMGMGVAADNNNALIEPNMIWIARGLRLTGSLLASTENDYGYAADAQWTYYGFNASGNMRRLYADEERVDEQINTNDPFSAQPLLGTSYNQYGLNLNYQIPFGSVSYNGSYSDRQGFTSKINSVALNATLFNYGRTSLSSTFSVTKENENYSALLSFTYQFNTDHWSNSARPSIEHREYDTSDGGRSTDYQERLALQANWYDRDLLPGDLNINNQLEVGTGSDSLLNSVQYQQRLIDIDAQLLNDKPSDGELRTSYSATLRSGFVIGGDYQPSLGGTDSREAAIVIDVEGDDSGDSYFDILINGQQRGYAKVGQRSVITVTPYDTYNVRLVARGANPLNYRDRVDTVTVYPGNVVKLEWQAESVNIVFGRVVDANGEAVANAVIKGAASMAVSDSFGLFQAELASGEQRLILKSATGVCMVTVPGDYETNNGVGFVGDLTCLQQGGAL
ncbi:CS1-pili formation C-terminal domain-containing protein [Sinobacterium norvegicum]|uniref:CS1-pili formation C-terminal domain-containing protein n=1 Tax=Sinobacterium norvegicum TaxID=1641715 RepID=UPI001F1D3F95|nr:CS1-pili formation C-terminal domain-containing protein [Sinobacterium norvegicum]